MQSLYRGCVEGQARGLPVGTERHLDVASCGARQRETPDPLDPNPLCPGEAEAVSTGFWDDLRWTIYVCLDCHTPIAAIDGMPHWWNYVLSPEAWERLGVDQPVLKTSERNSATS
jgi:hypothetical protein